MLKNVPTTKTGLKKLPTTVRNKMGYMNKGGMVKKKGKKQYGKRRTTLF